MKNISLFIFTLSSYFLFCQTYVYIGTIEETKKNIVMSYTNGTIKVKWSNEKNDVISKTSTCGELRRERTFLTSIEQINCICKCSDGSKFLLEFTFNKNNSGEYTSNWVDITYFNELNNVYWHAEYLKKED